MRFAVFAFAALTLAACGDDSPQQANATVSTAEPQIPTTKVYAGMPPVRFMQPRIMIVSAGTVSQCGVSSVPNTHFAACLRDEFIVHVPNPCDYPTEVFATRLCHEMGHLNGWPYDHGP